MNCTLLPLNKIYRPHFFSRADSSPRRLFLALSACFSFSLCLLLHATQFSTRNWECLHSKPWPRIATEGWQHCEIVEELTGCINIITQYGGVWRHWGQHYYITQSSQEDRNITEATRPVGLVYHIMPLLWLCHNKGSMQLLRWVLPLKRREQIVFSFHWSN